MKKKNWDNKFDCLISINTDNIKKYFKKKIK